MKAPIILLFVFSILVAHSQNLKKEMEIVGNNIFTMLKSDDYSNLDNYLVNESNFNELISLYELSHEEEQEWISNKTEMIEGTRESVIEELKKSRQYCIDNNLNWSDAQNWMDINTEALQITFSLGKLNAGCDIYMFLAKLDSKWIILALEV